LFCCRRKDFTYVYPILSEFKLQGSFYIPGKTFKDCSLLDVNKIHFILASTDIPTLLDEVFQQLDYYRGCEFNIEPNEILFEKYATASRFDTKEVIFVQFQKSQNHCNSNILYLGKAFA
jgi:hypothetical protein